MRPETPRSLVAALALAAACAGDPPATALTAAATTGSSSGTSDTGAGEPTTGAAASTSDGGGTSTSGASSTSTGTSTSTSTGTSTGSGSTAVDEPPLPGCGDAPPDDFDVEASAPADGATVAGPTSSLEVTLGGTILADATARFYLREVHALTDADDFTIVVLPDTQNYSQFIGNYPQYKAQTKWVWDHRNTDRIVAVLHNGDVVQHGNLIEVEWTRAVEAMATLETKAPKFPDGIPYGVAVGNHDNGAYAHDDEPFGTHLFNKHFGVARFADRAYYGGHHGDTNDNSWILVRAGNLDVVMVSLEYRGELGQDPAVLAWARGIFEAHPHALGIVNSHHIVKANGDFGVEGQQIYDVMKTVDNVQLMTSGHIKEFRARRTDVHKGHTIHSMLADYQDLIVPADSCAGGCGYLRIWRFSPQHDQLKVETYSPSLDKSMTGPEEQFTLTVDLSAATGVFALAGATSGPGAQLALPVDGLKSGATYEWYAVVKECGARVTTPKRSFTVE